MTTPRDTGSGPGDSPGRPRAQDLPTPPPAVPRAGGPSDHGSGWAASSNPTPRPTPRPAPHAAEGPTPGSARSEPTTVLPDNAAARRPAGPRPLPNRTPPRVDSRTAGPTGARTLVGRSRRARLALRRIDPWSVFLFSLVASVFVGIALVVAVAVLYAVLGTLGVTESVNELFAEVTGGSPTTDALLTGGRIIGGTAVLAVVNVVFLTLLATLGALLYNLCASFTGGVELTLGERD